MTTRALLLAAVLAALGVAGCGGDTKTVTVTAPQTTTNDFPPPPETDTTPPTTTAMPLPSTDTTDTTDTTGTGTETDETPSDDTGPSQDDAQEAARSAANDYTGDKYGISGDPSDWSAVCTGEGDTFSCVVTFNGGQCDGRLTLTGPGLTPGNRQIGCGE
jgi:hypothetical protein